MVLKVAEGQAKPYEEGEGQLTLNESNMTALTVSHALKVNTKKNNERRFLPPSFAHLSNDYQRRVDIVFHDALIDVVSTLSVRLFARQKSSCFLFSEDSVNLTHIVTCLKSVVVERERKLCFERAKPKEIRLTLSSRRERI